MCGLAFRLYPQGCGRGIPSISSKLWAIINTAELWAIIITGITALRKEVAWREDAESNWSMHGKHSNRGQRSSFGWHVLRLVVSWLTITQEYGIMYCLAWVSIAALHSVSISLAVVVALLILPKMSRACGYGYA